MRVSGKPVSPRPSRSKKLYRIIILAVGLPLIWAAGVWLFAINLQSIQDHITARQNPLSSEVVAIADDAGLNPHGKFLLAASRTQLNDRGEFNENCPIKEEQAYILGCYVFDDKRIYIFNVVDERVIGIKTVTTTHEMLHAAYDRLSSGEKSRVNKLLYEEKSKIDNQQILDIMKFYEETEPGQEFNELHSLLATEERILSPELEKYYEKYFIDRGKVVAVYEKYQKVFDELQSRIADLQNKMEAEEGSINTAMAQYETDLAAYNRDVDLFNSCADRAGCFTSMATFNSQYHRLIARGQDLDAQANQINAAIDQYNADVEELNALGVEAEKLNQSLNSHAEVAE